MAKKSKITVTTYHIDDVMGVPNRITKRIKELEGQMAQRLKDKLITKKNIEKARKGLDMGLDEFAKFQELKSLALVQGILTQAEAQTIYVLLGNTPEHFNNQSFEAKHTLTTLFAELLGLRCNLPK